jgi:glucose-1-phosphate thymidylyltransferase
MDYIVDRLLETDVNAIIVSTNLKFKPRFEAWRKDKRIGLIEIVAETSRSEDEKLGAVGALAELTPKLEPDDYLIIAGDNIFTAEIGGMIDFYKQKKAPVIAVIKARSAEEVLRGSSILLEENMRIARFKEKPMKIETMLIGACIYILPYKTLLRTSEYLQEGGDRDEPGNFIEWLCKKETVYGYMLRGRLWDIGTIEGYEELRREFQAEGHKKESSQK